MVRRCAPTPLDSCRWLGAQPRNCSAQERQGGSEGLQYTACEWHTDRQPAEDVQWHSAGGESVASSDLTGPATDLFGIPRAGTSAFSSGVAGWRLRYQQVADESSHEEIGHDVYRYCVSLRLWHALLDRVLADVVEQNGSRNPCRGRGGQRVIVNCPHLRRAEQVAQVSRDRRRTAAIHADDHAVVQYK